MFLDIVVFPASAATAEVALQATAVTLATLGLVYLDSADTLV